MAGEQPGIRTLEERKTGTMTVKIEIQTNPGATWEDLSCALDRLSKRCDANDGQLDPCRLRVSMAGLEGIVSADLDVTE
jgi:hypothetical protein